MKRIVLVFAVALVSASIQYPSPVSLTSLIAGLPFGSYDHLIPINNNDLYIIEGKSENLKAATAEEPKVDNKAGNLASQHLDSDDLLQSESYTPIIIQESNSIDVTGGSKKSKNVSDIVFELIGSLNITEHSIKLVSKTIQKIDGLEEKVDKRLSDIRIQLGDVREQEIEVTKKALETYRSVKSILRRTKMKLFKLADKTVKVTKSLSLYTEGWISDPLDPDGMHKKKYLKTQIKMIKKLLESSDSILKDAITKYSDAADKLDLVDVQLLQFRRYINKALNTSQEKNEFEQKSTRLTLYVSTGGTLIGTILLDILGGCLGFCSGAAIIGIITGATHTETSLYELNQKLKEFEKSVTRAEEDIKQLRTTGIKELLASIQDEEELILKWKNSVELLADEVELFDEKEFLDLPMERKNFAEQIRSLHDAASDFLKRPEDIFGSNPKKLKQMI